MPAYTVRQLEEILGNGVYNYVDPRGNFIDALRQVLPRLYSMGLWRDLTHEVSLSGANGYISLPADTDAILACTINDMPRQTRSMWHDIRIVGRQAVTSPYFGIIDAGYFPTLLELYTVQGVAEGAEVPVSNMTLAALYTDTATAIPYASFGGVVDITVSPVTGGQVNLAQGANGPAALVFTHTADFNAIVSITYTDVTVSIDLVDAAFPLKVIATIPTGSGVLRYRRFRNSSASANTVIHLLVKRGCPSDLTESTVIHLGNIGAIKHGLLGLIAEDNADLDKSARHWATCGKLLDVDLSSITGSAKPTLSFDLSGCGAAAGIHNLY